MLTLLRLDDFEAAHMVLVLWMTLLKKGKSPSKPESGVLPQEPARRQQLFIEILSACGERYIAAKPNAIVGKDDQDQTTRLFNRYGVYHWKMQIFLK